MSFKFKNKEFDIGDIVFITCDKEIMVDNKAIGKIKSINKNSIDLILSNIDNCGILILNDFDLTFDNDRYFTINIPISHLKTCDLWGNFIKQYITI